MPRHAAARRPRRQDRHRPRHGVLALGDPARDGRARGDPRRPRRWCVHPAHAGPLPLAEVNRRTAARLTPDQVATIRRTARTHAATAIAAALGVPSATALAVRAGRTFPDGPWPDPDPPGGAD